MNLDAEWLETDGRGGFASGTVGGVRTRRYHALLLPATNPPVNRVVLVNGLEVFLETAAGRWPLSTQRYPGGGDGQDVVSPRGLDYLVGFELQPWPRWTFQFPDGTRLEHEVFIHQATGLTALSWKLLPTPAASGKTRLEVRPLFSGRDYHATHHENTAFAFQPVSQEGGNAAWQMYPGLPLTRVWSSGTYRHDPKWYQHFLYSVERDRGLDCLEDLALPGVFTFDLGGANQDASMLLGAVMDLAAPGMPPGMPPAANAARLLPALRNDEQKRRSRYADLLEAAADAYVVRGVRGPTVIAGYPWFTDWGRDTFISLRGLCLATKRFEEAREILLAWTGSVSAGMLPNRFPDGGEAAAYNSVDASLWFIIAAHDYLALAPASDGEAAMERWTRDRNQLLAACEAILDGFTTGTRYGIRADPDDGLLLAGEPGVALTWMDAVIDGQAVTPRAGKPVEIQALWLNALFLMAAGSPRWRLPYERAHVHFATKFWNPARNCLFDVVDCDGQPGVNDARVRPNQVFAVGGLPLVLLPTNQAQAVMQTVERELLTPVGLRTLARGEPGYCPRYTGGSVQRDSAYHQGTVWPWLLGPFVEGWVRMRGDTEAVWAEARSRFVEPLLASLPVNAGLGHLAEIADAELPHALKGCPCQAWSVGELARLSRLVLR